MPKPRRHAPRVPYRYPSIGGPEGQHVDQPCLAFEKLDGSNLWFLWDQQKGWSSFGTRRYRITPDHTIFGPAWVLFRQQFADGIAEVIRKHKEYRNVKRCIAFCEYFGEKTFSGLHEPGDDMRLTLIDVYLFDANFVPPLDFRAHFGHLETPTVVYEGPFNWQLVRDVYDGKYQVTEGVVIKGRKLKRRRKGTDEHEIWTAKCKTKAYLAELQRHSGENPDLQREYEELREMHDQILRDPAGEM